MGFKKQNSRKKAENGDFQVVGSLLYAHYPIHTVHPDTTNATWSSKRGYKQ